MECTREGVYDGVSRIMLAKIQEDLASQSLAMIHCCGMTRSQRVGSVMITAYMKT